MNCHRAHRLAQVVIDRLVVVVVLLHVVVDLVVEHWNEVGANVKVAWPTQDTEVDHFRERALLEICEEVFGEFARN